jgi:hypothetical protein
MVISRELLPSLMMWVVVPSLQCNEISKLKKPCPPAKSKSAAAMTLQGAKKPVGMLTLVRVS